MAPTRSSTTETQKQKTKKSRRLINEAFSAQDVPGVQKIKSSLRQTRRLLAKDSLAADVRIETERRLKSLESDLAKAERIRKERHFAVKYHKIKFFERQKVCRKIKHTKKALNGVNLCLDKLASLHETLHSHRVDLNYILHYPKTRKYISLFPPEGSTVASGMEISDTDKHRDELRGWVRVAMETGEMDAEPEVMMEKRLPQAEVMEWEEESESRPKAGEGGKQKVATSKSKGVSGDTFFEAYDGDQESQNDDG